MRLALFIARFAAKAQSPELRFGDRTTVIATNALRREARKHRSRHGEVSFGG
jgi:hypothetical protein